MNLFSSSTGKSPTHSWKISADSNWVEICHGRRVLWKGATTGIELADGSRLHPAHPSLCENILTLDFPGELTVRHQLILAGDRLRVTTTLLNRSPRPVPLRQVVILAGTLEPGLWQRVFAQSETMTGKTGIFRIPGTHLSDSCLGLTDAAGASALVAGFEKLDSAFYRFRLEESRSDLQLTPSCLREDIPLPAGGTLELSPLWIGVGPSLSGLMEEYAGTVAQAMAARPARGAMTGWCSWYHYYGKETAADILTNARHLAASPLRGKLKVVQIDDGWNRTTPTAPRNWGDWFPGAKFPQGMRAVADELHALGYQAGLWLAPFSVDAGTQLAQEHPEWILRSRNASTGKLEPAGPGNVFGLDLTHPGVLEWLRTTFDRVFHDWGFDYVKIDFLIHSLFPGQRHDSGKTSAEAFRQGLQVIRNSAGKDKFILACGSPFGPAIGLCDAMRIGFDVGGRWDAPMRLEEWPQGNCSFRAAAYPTLFRQWMHRRWWQNDPDCLIVRDRAVPFEVEAMTQLKIELPAPNLSVAPSDFGLSRNEAEFWVRAVWFTGGMGLVSEVWPELSTDRQELLTRAFPPHPWRVRWFDYYEHPDVCVLQTRDGPPMVGIFNLSDEPRTVRLPLSHLPASRAEARPPSLLKALRKKDWM
ncbi:MAG: alpha-galactosidase [Betaproteobacteria bacterium]|nr:alpha-galactosidase [Betaproteobacteria bacterium]